MLQVMESLVPEYMVSGHVRKRTGSILEGVSPSNVYPCSDGEYLIGANQDAVFRRLCAAMGRPDLADDPRYATHLARGQHLRELDEIIASWTRTLTLAEVEALMIAHSLPAKDAVQVHLTAIAYNLKRTMNVRAAQVECRHSYASIADRLRPLRTSSEGHRRSAFVTPQARRLTITQR